MTSDISANPTIFSKSSQPCWWFAFKILSNKRQMRSTHFLTFYINTISFLIAWYCFCMRVKFIITVTSWYINIFARMYKISWFILKLILTLKPPLNYSRNENIVRSYKIFLLVFTFVQEKNVKTEILNYVVNVTSASYC